MFCLRKSFASYYSFGSAIRRVFAMFRRENTFRIDYSNVPRKPSISDVHLFIGLELELTRDQVVRLQISKTLGCAFVKTVDLATAQKVVEENGEKHELAVVDKSYPLRISMEDGAVEVNLSDLSEGVSNATIAQFLGAYGEVFSIHEILWGENYHFESIATGTRVARMMVKKNIPSFVAIDSEIASVSYFGQRQTCRHCGEFVHNGVSCVINKKLLIQKLAANQTYANVTKQPLQPQAQSVSKTVEQDPEMGPPKPSQPPKPKGPANPSANSKQPGTTGASQKKSGE